MEHLALTGAYLRTKQSSRNGAYGFVPRALRMDDDSVRIPGKCWFVERAVTDLAIPVVADVDRVSLLGDLRNLEVEVFGAREHPLKLGGA